MNLERIKEKLNNIGKLIKGNKKVQIGLVSSIVLVTVAGGTLVYVKYTNGKAEGNKLEVTDELLKEAEEMQKIESEADIILTENENGELVATDKEGNIVAEGEEVEKLVEEKKEKGETVVAKTENGTTVKVDKVDGDKVTSSSGQTVKPSTKPPVVADNNNSNSKPSTGTEKPSIDNNSGNSNNSTSNSNNGNNNNNNSGTNKPSTGNNNGSSNNSGSTSKPQEPSKPTQPEKPVEPETKPEVKPEPPKRTWTYMADMSRETFNLMNKFRQDNGIAPLKWSDSEHARAKKQAEYNIKNMDTGHDFGQISIGGTRFKTPQGFINGWASSPGHKASMLDGSYIEGAVAVYRDSNGEFAVVASFYDGW